MCIPDLVIKYFWNNTGEIKRIVFTYADLLPSVFVVDLGLIHLCRSVGIHLLWKICDVRTVSMASWNRGFFFASVLFRYESTIILICLYEELFVAYQQWGLVYWLKYKQSDYKFRLSSLGHHQVVSIYRGSYTIYGMIHYVNLNYYDSTRSHFCL